MSKYPSGCRACGTPHKLSPARIYSVNNDAKGVEGWESSTVKFCIGCRVRHGLYCDEHGQYMVCAYDQDIMHGRLAQGMPRIYACCPQCVEFTARNMSSVRAEIILAYVTGGDYTRYFLTLTKHLATSEAYGEMGEVERIFFGVFMYMGLYGHTFAEFVDPKKWSASRNRGVTE